MRIAAVLLLALMIVVPANSVFPAPPERDAPREVESARHKLRDARQDLANAGNEWGGHRAEAMKHIDAALRELDEAERWAHDHHDMR
jgi:hypothetical protein